MSSRLKFMTGLMALTVVLRLVPYFLTNYDIKIDAGAIYYPWNFSPLMAVSLFSGAYVTDRRLKFGLPILTMLLSDMGIWAATGQFAWGFPTDRWAAYLCLGMGVVLGMGLNPQSRIPRTVAAVGGGVLAEALFFVVTNFLYFWGNSEFPQNSVGLMACYVAAVPFAGRSFVSTLCYSLLLFSPLTDRVTGRATVRQRALLSSRPASVSSASLYNEAKVQ